MFCLLTFHVRETSPGKNNDLHLIYLPYLQCKTPGSIGLRFVRQTRPLCTALYTISVRQTEVLPCKDLLTLQSGFLRIPSRDGHPCLWLTVPTAKSVADFHRQVVAHAGRTGKIRITKPVMRIIFMAGAEGLEPSARGFGGAVGYAFHGNFVGAL